MKAQRLLRTALLGALGGLAGWIFVLFARLIQSWLNPLPLLDGFIYEGIAVGLGLGLITNAQKILLQGTPSALSSRVATGLGFGLLSGWLGFGLAQILAGFPHLFPISLIRVLAWLLLGTFLGLLTHIGSRSEIPVRLGTLRGIVGGAVGGIGFEISIQTIPLQISGPVAMMVAGAALLLAFNFRRIKDASACLRILTGSNAGQIHLLDRPLLSIGYSSSNDIVLEGYSEVCPIHATLKKENSLYQVVPEDAGGNVLLNYRQVEQQTMKKGDILKIGTALFQYCEVT